MLEDPDNQYGNKERLQELGEQDDPYFALQFIVYPVKIRCDYKLAQSEHFIALVNQAETVGRGFCSPGDVTHYQLRIRVDPQSQVDHIG